MGLLNMKVIILIISYLYERICITFNFNLFIGILEVLIELEVG